MDGRISLLLSVILIIAAASGLGDAAKHKHSNIKANHRQVGRQTLKKAVVKKGGKDNMIPVGMNAGSDSSKEEDTFITRGDDAPMRGRPYMVTIQFLIDNYYDGYENVYYDTDGADDGEEGPNPCGNATYHKLEGWWHVCGGALIAADTVLTAAHCVDWLTSKEEVRVGLGWWDLSLGENNNGSQIRTIKSYTIHPEYDSDVFWTNGPTTDVAIITLDTPADLVPGVVDTINLQRNRWNSGECDLAGWGETKLYCGASATLQYSSMEVLTHRECSTIWGLAGITVTRDEICSVNWSSYASASFGDSGSVLVCGGEAAGVVSWGESRSTYGPQCGGCLPSVFARVTYSRRWIYQTMRKIRKDRQNVETTTVPS